MAARQYVLMAIESSYGTAKTSPVLGTDKAYLRLSENTAFKADLIPQIDPIMYGGGIAIPAEEVADVYLAQGSIATVLYPGIWSTLLLNWAITQINSGRTTPWTTTDSSSVMPVGDLASLSFYRAFINPDGTYVKERWSGCKCTKWRLAFSSQPTGRKLIFTADWVGIKCATNSVETSPEAAPTTALPAPAETDYPTGPWKFSDLTGSTGTCKIASARAQIVDLSIGADNVIDTQTYESKFIQLARFNGRKTTAEIGLRYKPSPDDLANYQARTALDSEFILDNGTNTLKIDFNAKNRFVSRERVFENGQEYAAKMTLSNYFDPAAAADISVTLT